MLKRVWPALALSLTVLALACSSGGGAKPNSTGTGTLSRTGEAGGVTVEATWLTEDGLGAVDADLAQYSLNEFVLFKVSLDTHSGDLSKLDLKSTASLKQSGADMPAEAWVDLNNDSHHRSGVLVFPRDLQEGPAELALNVKNDELVLAWEAPPTR
jgi:hypothetical protein